MLPDHSINHAPKRRRVKQLSRALDVGGRAISLEGYLAPPKAARISVKDDLHTKQTDRPRSSSATKRMSRNQEAQQQDWDSPPLWRETEGTALSNAKKALPIWQHREEIQAAVRDPEANIVIVVGETGSGKSTQIPQYLYQEPWCRRHKVRIDGGSEDVYVGGVVAITQPRRVAATTLAHRVSQEVGTPLGKGRREGLVGYSVRFDHQVPRGAKVKFLTEGTLLQELFRDHYLRQYSAIIIDEIHERSLNVDLIVGFLKQIISDRYKSRGGIPLKVVIMSATANVEAIYKFFTDGKTLDNTSGDVRVLRIQGRQFPVEIIHENRPVADLQESLLKRIFKIHLEEPLPGDILAFLTGQEEIEMAQKLIEEYAGTLASNVPSLKVVPLFGQLSVEAQREAFLPVKVSFTRKIVLATNIAETSVTVPGVRYVIDGGKAKIKQFRPRLGMESLLAKPISRSSAVQRTGRAGREGPGKCYRLYTEQTFQSLQPSELPEILRNDVLGAVLTMKARGIHDVLAFPLMDAPEPQAIERALVHLHFLGALDLDGSITQAGTTMVQFPISAPLGAVLLKAMRPEFNCVLEVIDIISCLTSGDDIFLAIHSEESQDQVEEHRKELIRREGDIITYLTAIQQYCAENVDRHEWCRKRKISTRNMKQAVNIRRQLRGMCLKEGILTETVPSDPQPFQPISPERAEAIVKCFLRGFALKTAMLAPDGSYVTVHGKHIVAIHPSSVLHGQKKEAILFLEHVYTAKNYAKKVSAIQAVWVADALEDN